MIFAKLEAGFRRNPKVRRAGYHASNVFLFVLEVNADLGATGVVPAGYVDPFYLADQMMCTEAEATEGLRRAIAAKLLELREDGTAEIVGWDDEEWGRGAREKDADDGATRTRRWREKNGKGPKKAQAPKPAGPSPVTTCDAVTSPTSPPVTGDDRVTKSDAVTTDTERESEADPDPDPDLALSGAGAQVGVGSRPTGSLFDHARDTLEAARRAIDPTSMSLGDFPGHGRELLDRLRESGPHARQRLEHALACAIARAQDAGTVDALQFSTFASERAWGFVQGSSVEGFVAAGAGRGRTPPARASPFGAKPAGGVAAALEIARRKRKAQGDP